MFLKNVLKNNKIAKGDVNIFSHLTFFSILNFFAALTGNDASKRLNTIEFVISRPISVEIDISLAFKKNSLGGHFDFFSQTLSAKLAKTDLADFH